MLVLPWNLRAYRWVGGNIRMEDAELTQCWPACVSLAILYKTSRRWQLGLWPLYKEGPVITHSPSGSNSAQRDCFLSTTCAQERAPHPAPRSCEEATTPLGRDPTSQVCQS